MKMTCLDCEWTGSDDELALSVIDDGFGLGADRVCPNCGSPNFAPSAQQ